VLAQPGDNWMIHVAVEQCQKGDVLVVGCTADNTDGMFGELLAVSSRVHGVAGLVIDAGVRVAMADAIHLVFVIACIAAVFGLATTFFTPRRQLTDQAPEGEALPVSAD